MTKRQISPIRREARDLRHRPGGDPVSGRMAVDIPPGFAHNIRGRRETSGGDQLGLRMENSVPAHLFKHKNKN